tara:strand:- start:23 stop:646 length:624 start_codon:yes stop_codon:yes gene_type:complete
MANSISLTDLDETIINPSGSTIHFGNVSFPAETLTHLIKFNGRGNFSRLVSTYVDVNDLTSGSSPTPESVFGNHINLVSIRNKEGDIWFSDGSTAISALNTILNNTVYSLQFSATTNARFEIIGSKLDYPINVVVPLGDSWLPVPVSVDVKINNSIGPFKGLLSSIVSIIDNGGRMYEDTELTSVVLKPGEGYYVRTSQPFTLTFNL